MVQPCQKRTICVPPVKKGRYNLCTRLGFHGLAGGGGGFAEYTTFFEDYVHKIPDSLSYEDAALVETHGSGTSVYPSGKL